ncbi:MAG: serine/threonine protein kinase [Gemmataceae bacterium]|nr:serine/threonine protein kinase [Gemmataceae bacterium]MDW8266918.1 serine/threonine-protein kinase [Gemmataceae bacterium]
MNIQTVAQLVEAIRVNRLLEQAQLDELPAIQARFSEPRALAGYLIQQGWLTPYQVNQLFHGHGSDLVLGQYVLLERLGEGGMGHVFKGRHVHLGRIVALKIIRREHLADAEAVRRFRREIQAAAQLSHPNVVMAYDADQVGDTHFFVMEYVEGISLTRLMKEHGPPPIPVACEYIRQAALGLQHAHEKGLVHRDIKPGNLLVTRVEANDWRVEGATPYLPAQVGGWPTQGALVKILDMGLARLYLPEQTAQARDSQLTQRGQVLGTPDYMAPEQAIDPHAADIRADIYSLGCTFYYLLTGQVPFPGGTGMEKLLRHRTEEPTPVEALRPEVPPGLGALVRRLMAKRASDRPQTPGEVADILATGLRTGAFVPVAQMVDEPPAASIGGTLDLPEDAAGARFREPGAGRWRKPTVVALVGFIGVLSAWWLWSGWSAEPTRRAGESGRARTTAPKSTSTNTTDLHPAAQELQALRRRWESRPSDPDPLRRDLLAFRLRYPGTPWAQQAAEGFQLLASPLDRLERSAVRWPGDASLLPLEVVAAIGDPRQRHWGPVRAVAFHPRAPLLASGGHDRVVRLWNPRNMKERAVLTGHTGFIQALAFSPDGERLASAGADGTIHLWDNVTGDTPRLARVLRRNGVITAVAFDRDGDLLISNDSIRGLALWDLTAGEPQPRPLAPLADRGGRPLAANADGSRLAVADNTNQTLRLYAFDGTKASLRARVTDLEMTVQSLALTANGQRVAAGSRDGPIQLWDLVDGTLRPRATLTGHRSAVQALAFSPDGQWLASASLDGTVRVWDGTGDPAEEPFVVTAHGAGVNAVAFSADSQWLATGGLDSVVRLWDMSRQPLRESPAAPGEGGEVQAMALSPDGKTLAINNSLTGLRLFDITGPEPAARSLKRYFSTGFSSSAVTWSPDGQWFAVSGENNTVRLFPQSAVSRDEMRRLGGHDQRVVALAFSEDAQQLACGCLNGLVCVWDLTGSSPRLKHVLRGPTQRIRAMAFSPDGRVLVASGDDSIVWSWDLTQAAPAAQRAAESPIVVVRALCFSPDGKRLALGVNDRSIRLWDVDKASLTQNRAWEGHTQPVTGVAFTPDGKRLISTGEDGAVVVWETAQWRERRRVTLNGPIVGLSLALDGRHLATLNGNQSVFLLRLSP